ncbi:MAG: hypothetical protein H7Z72_21870 [Bacteroidetes bacterium]|nr:hypothetical protein [Fibrella sp.]
MKKWMISLLLTLTACVGYAQTNEESDLESNDSLYFSLDESNPLFSGAPTVLASHSLGSFCPKPVPIATQAARWPMAVSYAMTVQVAGLRHWSAAQAHQERFSARFLFDLLPKSSAQSCKLRRDWLGETKRILEDIGQVREVDYPNGTTDCGRKPDPEFLKRVRRYDVRSFNRLFMPTTNDEGIDLGGKWARIIQSVSRNHPVILVLVADRHFHAFKGATWTPRFDGGNPVLQTVVIVGFDRRSQTMTVVNPSAADWGEGGFATLRYKDLIFTKYAFELVLNAQSESLAQRPPRLARPPVRPSGSTVQTVPPTNDCNPVAQAEPVLLRGDLKIQAPSATGSFDELALIRQPGGYYQTKHPIAVAAPFQLVSGQAQAGSYVYVFSLDPTGKAELHYPYALTTYGLGVVDRVSPVVPENQSQVVIPAPVVRYDAQGQQLRTERALVKEQPGTDWLVVLYSTHRLECELPALMQQLAGTNANFVPRFRQVFGPRLIQSDQLQLPTDHAGFAINSRQRGYIVPLLVKIDGN